MRKMQRHFGDGLAGAHLRAVGPGLQAQYRRHARGARRARSSTRCCRPARACAPTIRWRATRRERIYAGRRGLSAVLADAYEAAAGRRCAAIVTEWQEFRSPDFERLKELLKSAGDLRRPQSLRPGAWCSASGFDLLRDRPRQAARRRAERCPARRVCQACSFPSFSPAAPARGCGRCRASSIRSSCCR